MKKNIYILIACLFTAMLAGCSVDETGIYGSFPYLEVDTGDIKLVRDASTKLIEFDSNRGVKVTIEFDREVMYGRWLTATASDGVVELRAEATPFESERSATIHISTPNGLIKKSINVTQADNGEETSYESLTLESKEAIRANSITKIEGELIIGKPTSAKTRAAYNVNTVERGDYQAWAPTDVDDSDMKYLADTIHYLRDEKLSVINTKITKFPLDLMQNGDINVSRLYLPYNEITTLPSAEVLNSLNLHELSLEGNAINDISNLKSNTRLSYLNIAHTNVYDLSPLMTMDLSELIITGLPLSKPQLDIFKEKYKKNITVESIREDEAVVPIIYNIEAEVINETTVRLTAKIDKNGGSDIKSVGFYIGTTRNINDMYYKEANISSDGTISYEHTVETLIGKVYHARAAATNSKGEGFSEATSYGTRISDEDIRLKSTSEIEDFYNNSYSHINGSLYVGILSSYHHEGIELPEESDYSYKYFWPWDLSDISQLSGLVEVTEGLYLSNTKVTSIDPIAHVSGMHTLFLRGNKLKSIPELGCASTVTRLDVARNQLTSFSFVDKLPNLEKLYLGNFENPSKETNDIGVLTGLEKYTNLKILDLSGLPLHQFQVDDLKKLMPDTEIMFKSGGRTPHLPTVGEGSVNKEDQKAILSGYVVKEGKSKIIEYGFYFGKDKNNLERIVVGKEIAENKTFTHEVTITDEDTYYFYPFAVNSRGESRNSVLSFTMAYDNLSEFGTANSYIVTEEGRYRFDATLKGFSSVTIRPASVEVLWETRHTYVPFESGAIIESIELVGGEVEFSTTGNEGNALIAVKDASGEILWSWQIWATDQPEIHEYQNGYGSFYLMDRNLGATRADRGSGEKWRESVGTLYQWGRKDPFVYESSFGYFMYKPSIEDVVKHPTEFAANYGDYWTDSPMDNLWNPDSKTMWDPCPPGYMVARKEAYDYMTINGWEWDYGRSFYYDGYNGGRNQAWFPNTPYIDPSGYNSWQESQGWVRTSGPADWNINVPAFYFNGDGSYYSNPSAADALPVRCMRMNDKFIVQTLAPTSGETTITARGNLVLTMEVEIEEKGFILSDINDNPGIYEGYSHMVTASDNAKGNYTCTFTDLQPNTKYYVRAYAKGDGEYRYGETMTVITSSPGSGEGFTGDDFEW